MKKECNIESAKPQTIKYVPKTDLLSYLGLSGFSESNKSEIGMLLELLEDSEGYELLCIAPLRR